MAAIAVVLSLLVASLGAPCGFLVMPVQGPIVRDFAPVGRFAGHWGVDIAVAEGTVVGAPGPGVITFAGSVAGRLSVTVDHGGGIKTSVSYLGSIAVTYGVRVAARHVVGRSGVDHGAAGLDEHRIAVECD